MDVLHDNSFRTWFHIGDEHQDVIPNYVMDYSLPTKEAASQLNDELFADPARRLFPIDSPAATWLSAAYFDKHSMAGELPYKIDEEKFVHEVIMKAAEVYGVAADVKAIDETLRTIEIEKTAESDDTNFGWLVTDNAGQVVERRYAMFDERGVKKASNYFAEYRDRYPAKTRMHIARRIMGKAAALGVEHEDLTPEVLREAGFGIPRQDILMTELLERAHLCKDAEVAAVIANINELIMGAPPEEFANCLQKVAEVIDECDQLGGLTQHYNKRILMPADFLYDIDLKTAEAAIEDAVELDKFNFSVTKLAALHPDVFASILGADFATAITKTAEGEEDATIDAGKLADNLYSLPRPDRVALEEHLLTLFG